MHILEFNDFVSVKQFFDQPHLRFVIDAMQAGNSPATIWVDDRQKLQSAFIWDKAHCLYWGGKAQNDSFNRAIQQLFAEMILPEAHARGLGIFKIYAADEGWTMQIASSLQTEMLQKRERSLFVLDAVEQSEISSPAGFRVERINPTLLNDSTYKNAEHVCEEIESCWGSLAKFWEAGFGFCTLNDRDAIVSWCTAEYVSTQSCGVGIETIEAFQGQGLATSVAQAFAQHCTNQGRTAYWDSWNANTPSIKVAHKAGFRKIHDYHVGIHLLKS